MVRFAIRYVKTLAVLLVAMLVYSLLVVPWIEPSKSPVRHNPLFSRTLPDSYWWEDYFPEGAWQRQNPKIINTNRGILLSKSWDSLDEKTWRLEPLTMIMPDAPTNADRIGDSSVQKPELRDMWVISAEQGATIHFEESPDLTGGKVPTIVRGDLSGAIEVTRQRSNPNGRPPWRLRTADLMIDRTQVSTRHEVLIEWGDSIIQGRELRILLRGDLLGNRGSVSPDWGPLDELELYHVDKIDVALPNGGIWAGMDPQQLHPQSLSQEQLRQLPARLRATCGGRFSFDFKRSLATLQNGVQIEHQLGALEADQFLCEKLSVFLEPPDKQESSPGANSEEAGMKLAGIRFKRLEAVGADSVRDFVGEKWVELRLPTLDLSSRSKQLHVDLQKQRIELIGQLSHQKATRSSVVLNQQGNEFRSPHIEYQLAAGEQDHSGGHLGWLFAEGPGELKTQQLQSLASPLGSYAETELAEAVASPSGGSTDRGTQEVRVRWHESLQMKPVVDAERPASQWIELVGNILVESAEHGFLASDRLEIWLQRDQEKPLVSAAPLPGESSGGYLPRRIYSSRPTTVATPALRAEVAELDAVFEYPAAPAVVSTHGEPDLTLSDSQGNPMYQWVTPPEELPTPGASQSARAQGPSEQERQIPVNISGNTLRAVLMQQAGQSWIERLQIDGPVRVSQESADTSEIPAWVVEGEQLLLATDRLGKADLQVEGKPARMILADGFVAGEAIRFNQTYNLIVMDHPGEFSVPKSLLVGGGRSGLPDEDASQRSLASVEWFNPPHCRWQGRMIFNGSVIRIEGGVEFDAVLRASEEQLWWIAGTSQLMELQLVEPLDFNSNDRQRVSLGKIVLSDEVHIRGSQLDRFGGKKSREEIRVPSLTFDTQLGQLIGNGPGWIQSRFRSASGLGQMASRTTSSGTQNVAAEALQGAFLAFRDSMVAELQQKEVTFDGKIELLTGPIRDWDDSVRPNQLEKLSRDQMLLNSDQLKVYDTAQLSTHAVGAGMLASGQSNETWEFKASGNVAFNGITDSGDYLGNGYQLTYSRRKNLLVLRGDGRDPAYLQRVPSGQNDSTFKAYVESVAINPESLQVYDLRPAAGGFELQLGNPQSPANWQPDSSGRLPAQPPPPNIPNPRQNFFDRRKASSN